MRAGHFSVKKYRSRRLFLVKLASGHLFSNNLRKPWNPLRMHGYGLKFPVKIEDQSCDYFHGIIFAAFISDKKKRTWIN